ncbi:MAG TPA: malto-oligosyltrehalose trehalohydrolase [Kineosporiaceae bacterium]|nr:malto-oligosyltrehalose trehalohydrolase [Kineosporiaceae bacterium]
MHRFSVWAPRASAVDLILPADERRLPMHVDGDSRWTLDVADAGHGTDYGFSLDGGRPLPDPRSPWQPAGVHAPSRVFDTSRHAWQDGGWRGRSALGGVFYELHIGTYTPQGTLDAAASRLDHLVELGVDVVEVMPVAAFDGRWGWGYDGVDLYAVHEPYGGPAALQRFVDACHRRGLAVCLDVVYNHVGPSGNYLGEFGPYFTGGHTTPWGDAANLDDEGCEHVRRWIVDNALRWFADFHLDALRLDAVHALVDDSPRHLLAQLSDESAALSARLGRPLSLVAESDLNDPRMIEPTSAGGLGMTAQWSDDLHHALHAWLTGETQGYYVDFGSVEDVARTLTRVFRHSGGYSTFRGRTWGRPVDPARHRGHRFLGYLQDHDQVGNRARGDRISASVSVGRQAVGAALSMASAFTPMIFMGEEWAASTPWRFFTDFPDPALGAAVREGRRSEFARYGWNVADVRDPQDSATRDASVLDWTELGTQPHARVLAWYRALTALRRDAPDLQADDLREVRVETGPDRLTMRRGGLDVHVNIGPSAQQFPAPAAAEVLLAWGRVEIAEGVLVLPPDSVAIVRRGASSGAAS